MLTTYTRSELTIVQLEINSDNQDNSQNYVNEQANRFNAVNLDIEFNNSITR